MYSYIQLRVETRKRPLAAKMLSGIPRMYCMQVGSEVVHLHDVGMAMYR
jgi:hypothetical protein